MDSIFNLQKRATELRNKTQVDSITPEEVGGLQYDILAYIAYMEQNNGGLGIRKVYTSVATMNADSNPIGSNGKPLRLGQLVTIYNPSLPTAEGTGNVYSYQKPGWQLIGSIGGVYELQAKIDAEAEARANGDDELMNYILMLRQSIGLNNGIAPLDSSGKIPSMHLPAYVDDVVEFAGFDESSMNFSPGGETYVSSESDIYYGDLSAKYHVHMIVMSLQCSVSIR